jgi:hypothetical protein
MKLLSNARGGLGLVLLGLVAVAIGVGGIALRDGIDQVFVASIVELVSYLLALGGVVAVLVGLVTAGVALLRQS